MANSRADSDAAAEQLFDELIARAWAIDRIVGTEATNVARPDVAAKLAAAALSHVGAVVDGGVDEGNALERVLWPNGARPVPADPWWLPRSDS